MPNGGSDNCGECGFKIDGDDDAAFCEIRRFSIADPYWTYCANQTKHNPLRITTPVGPVSGIGEDPYRRAVLFEAPDDSDEAELLELIERLRSGGLEKNSRIFHVALISQIGHQRIAGAAPILVGLAVADPEDSVEVTDSYFGTTSAAIRVEFHRLAALRALRDINNSSVGSDAIGAGFAKWRDGADADRNRRLEFTWRFIIDYQEPP